MNNFVLDVKVDDPIVTPDGKHIPYRMIRLSFVPEPGAKFTQDHIFDRIMEIARQGFSFKSTFFPGTSVKSVHWETLSDEEFTKEQEATA